MNGNCAGVNECDDPTMNYCDGVAESCVDRDDVNTAPGYDCVCNDGFQHGATNSTVFDLYGIADIFDCEDIDACADPAANDCSADAVCGNTYGSYNCTYANGYAGSGTHCENIDECTEGSHECDEATSTCNNFDGAYDCACNAAFADVGTNTTVAGFTIVVCDDVDECTDLSPCHANATCDTTFGGFNCTCADGYVGDGDILDLDGNPTSGTCDNECDVANGSDFVHNCHGNATCTDNDGSYECECLIGFSGDGTVCEDVDECAIPQKRQALENNCDVTLVVSTLLALMSVAVTMDGDGLTCSNVDKCDVANGSDFVHNCALNATCTDTEGSFECECDVEYSGNGTVCEDVDECANPALQNAIRSRYVEHAACTNTDGSYECGCDAGYEGDGLVECTNTDECLDAALHNCHADASCNDGGLNCTCDQGYYGDGVTCDNVNECDGEEDGHTCDVNADCSENDGGFDCARHAGWVGDGFTCTDFDERTDSADNNCNVNANCTNIDGSFECDCSTGWKGDGTDGTCTNADESTDGTHTCSENAVCDDLVNSFNCTCNDGVMEFVLILTEAMNVLVRWVTREMVRNAKMLMLASSTRTNVNQMPNVSIIKAFLHVND